MIRQATIVSAVLAAILAGGVIVGRAAAAAGQFSCTGVKIAPVSLAQTPMTGKLNLISEDKIALNLDDDNIRNTVTSDDRITLHFRTRDFTGEFFHYTNDLFLIYHSGHLAKLSCTPVVP